MNDHIQFKNCSNHVKDEVTLILFHNKNHKRRAEEDLRLAEIKKAKNYIGDDRIFGKFKGLGLGLDFAYLFKIRLSQYHLPSHEKLAS